MYNCHANRKKSCLSNHQQNVSGRDALSKTVQNKKIRVKLGSA